MVKEFLSANQVHYTLKNLNTDPVAREEFIAAGYRLPPVTIIDGEATIGYDPDRLEQLLARGEEPRVIARDDD